MEILRLLRWGYAVDSPGVGTAGGKQFDFYGSPNHEKKYKWQWFSWTWKWADREWAIGQPVHEATYPVYEYNAHAVYMHDCDAFPNDNNCVQRGSEDNCHGIAVHMEANIEDQGWAVKVVLITTSTWFRACRCTCWKGRLSSWRYIYKDDFHCGLIYEDKPAMDWDSNSYLEIARDDEPDGYRDGEGKGDWPLTETMVPPKTGYARISCLVKENSGSSYLIFQSDHKDRDVWEDAGKPCIGCEPGMFSENGEACVPCTGNSYQDEPNQKECKVCPTGYMVMEGDDKIDVNVEVNPTDLLPARPRSSVENCKPCPPGTYASTVGCTKCPQGFFRKTVDEADCQQCGLGQYGSVEGLVQCVECQKGMYTMSKGSLAVASCLTCASGRFIDEKGLDDSKCKACTAGRFQPHGEGGDGDFGPKW